MSDDNTDHLIKMARQIVLNSGLQRDAELAAERAADHIHRFWTPAMIKKLLESSDDSNSELHLTIQLLTAELPATD